MTTIESKDYEDYITEKPKVITNINFEQFQLIGEHRNIMETLTDKQYMSVKQIHALYWDSELEKYSKSTKTIYRYMDELENANLVKVAGFRKYKNSRNTEKLYCRSSILYFSRDSQKKEKWWMAKEYQERFNKFAQFLIHYENLKESKNNTIISLLNEYYEILASNSRDQLNIIEEYEQYANLFVGLSAFEIKRMLFEITMINIFRNHKDLIKKFQDLK